MNEVLIAEVRGEAKRTSEPRLPALSLAQERTEAAAARRFARRFGQDVRYCPSWKKWLIWDRIRWHIDDACEIEARAKRTGEEIWEEANVEMQHAPDGRTANAILGTPAI